MCKDTEPRALPEDSDSPKWFDGKKVIEIAFCEEFLTRHPMCCIHGRFYTADGPIPDDVVRRLIYEELKAHAVSGVGKAVATLRDVLRIESHTSGLPLHTDRIHVANVTLFLIGRGGEGKSRIGPVMRALFGTAMNTGSLSKVETSPFAQADLENKLVMVDDDIKLEALPQTHIIKAIVTAELPMDLERGESASKTGRTHIPPRIFKQATPPEPPAG